MKRKNGFFGIRGIVWLVAVLVITASFVVIIIRSVDVPNLEQEAQPLPGGNDLGVVNEQSAVIVMDTVNDVTVKTVTGKVSTVVTEADLKPALAFVERKIKEAKQKEEEGRVVKNFDPKKDGIIDLH